MKKIISILATWYRQEFKLSYFLAVAGFTAILIFINYRFDFETRYISYERNSLLRLLKYTGMYFLAFGGAYAWQFFFKDNNHLRSPKIWLLILLSVFLFSARAWYANYDFLTQLGIPNGYRTVVVKYLINLQGFVFLFLPCAVYWFITDRKSQPVYGFHAKGVVLWPYFILLLLMVPIVVTAGMNPDFLETYPRSAHLFLPANGSHNKLFTALYECCYGLDFVTTEFFFRGFLILALARFAGPNVILPMCVFYVTIHFEKPLGETISSFFGGWILGILAYYTRSIYGGIIVHLGIAMLMEAVASLMSTGT